MAESKKHSIRIAALILIAVFLAAMAGCGGAPPPDPYLSDDRDTAWINDIEYLRETLPKVHKNLFFRLSEEEFDRQLDDLTRDVPGYTDEQIAVSLSTIVSGMGDTHTSSGIGSEYQYPLELHWYSEGVYITGTDKRYEQLLYGRIITLNGIEMEDAAQALRPILAGANENWFRTQIVYYIPMPGVLRYFGVCDKDEIELVVALEGGQTETVTMTPMHYEDYEPATPPEMPVRLYESKPDLNYWYEYLKDDKTVYINYLRCAQMDSQSFSAFNKELWDFIGENDVDKIVLDIRQNRGGISYILNPFIREIKKSAFNHPDQFYVIIGKDTYSSAVLNAISLKTGTNAYFVGEATGGEPNHYGEVKQFKLPNSGTTIRYSTKYFHWLDEDVDTLAPDTVIPASFSSFRSGVDPALDWILARD